MLNISSRIFVEVCFVETASNSIYLNSVSKIDVCDWYDRRALYRFTCLGSSIFIFYLLEAIVKSNVIAQK